MLSTDFTADRNHLAMVENKRLYVLSIQGAGTILRGLQIAGCSMMMRRPNLYVAI
jgi:hypothetical protein